MAFVGAKKIVSMKPLLTPELIGASGRAASSGAGSYSSQQSIADQTKMQKNKFSPQRARDVCGSYIAGTVRSGAGMGRVGAGQVDARVGAYDQGNTCSLSSVMQTNVPQPFSTSGKVDRSGHLSMPGGQWASNAKYVSGDMQEHHHRKVSKTHSGSKSKKTLKPSE